MVMESRGTTVEPAAPAPAEQEGVATGRPRIAGLLSAGGVLGAVAASSCCVLPLVLVSVGITGSWMSGLTVLAPYQPILLALTAVFLGAGFYLVYRQPKIIACEGGEVCGTPRSRRLTKSVLWLGTVFMAIGIGFPYAAPLFY